MPNLSLVPNLAGEGLIDHLQEAIFSFDEHNQITALNLAAAALLHGERAALLGTPILQHSPELANLLQQTALTSETCQKHHLKKETPRQELEVSIFPLEENPPGRWNRLVVVRDLTNQVVIQQQLQQLRSLMDVILDSTSHGILVVGHQNEVLYQNPAFSSLWNLPGVVFGPAGKSWMQLVARSLKQPERFLRMVTGIDPASSVETFDILERSNGSFIECVSRAHAFSGNGTYRIWNFADITATHRTEQELRHMSTHDVLTGLYNRTHFEMNLSKLRGMAAYPVSMIMVDVDGLKKVNDQQGHSAGDQLLRTTGEILQKACRQEDVVARLGGDEFGLLLCHADLDTAAHVMERIQNLLTLQRIKYPGQPISLSLGADVANNPGELETLFRRSDSKMYEERYRRRTAAGLIQPAPPVE